MKDLIYSVPPVTSVDYKVSMISSQATLVSGDFSVLENVSSEVNRIVYFWEEYNRIPPEDLEIELLEKARGLLEKKLGLKNKQLEFATKRNELLKKRNEFLKKQNELLKKQNKLKTEIDRLCFWKSKIIESNIFVLRDNFDKLYDDFTTIKVLLEEFNSLEIEIQSIDAEIWVLEIKYEELETELKKNWYSNSWEIFEESTNKDVGIKIKTVSRKEDDLSNPEVKAAVEKLLSYKGEIEYQRARWRAAKPVNEWMRIAFVDTGKMNEEEISLIPMWAYQEFDPRLARAFHNARRNQKS